MLHSEQTILSNKEKPLTIW